MKNGYDQFFDKAKKNKSGESRPKTASAKPQQKASAPVPGLKVKKVKKAQRTPWGLVGALVILTGASFLGYQNLEQVEKFVSQVEIGFLGIASAEQSPSTKAGEKSPSSKEGSGEKGADAANAAKGQACPDVTQFGEEEMSHFAKLNERKKALDLREQELNTLEEELHKQKTEVEARIGKLEQIRSEISNVLKERVDVDEQRVATLVDFYSNMKPKQAADIFNDLNEDLAVEVLSRMKKKNAAGIMNLLKPEKARTLSEKFTGYKRR